MSMPRVRPAVRDAVHREGGGADRASRANRGRKGGRAVLVLASGLLCLSGLAGPTGCTTERVQTSDGRPLPPEPRRVPEAPAGLVPTRMSLIVAPRPTDADGDGWPDTIHATAAFFHPDHPLSIETAGTLRFTLWRMGEAGETGAEPLARWSLPLDRPPVAATRALYGPCYRVTLDLGGDGVERIAPTQADLRVSFEPAADPGRTVRASDDVRPVQLGRG